jgi:serine protease Do
LGLLIATIPTRPAAAQQGPPSLENTLEGMAVMAAAEVAVQQAIDRAAPSVVAIGRFRRGGGERRGGVNTFDFGIPAIGRPMGNLMVDSETPTEFGSGVILSEDGAILTCYHVIDDPEQNDYFVWVSDQAAPGASQAGYPIPAQVVRKPATVKAGDPWTDLAVLKIDAGGLPAMPMGDARRLRRGSFVVSLGNPYASARDGQASASWGLVSNLQRTAPRLRESSGDLTPPQSLQEFGTLIQTDARLNLGTSGGALIDMRGEMVGLTTSLAAVAGYEQAAGYAIPIDPAMLNTIASLREGKSPAFGFLGVEPTDAGGRRGALVRRVVPGMAGENAGIRSGDVVIGVDGQRIVDASDLFRELSRRAADAEVTLTVLSPAFGRQRTLVARLGKKRLALARPAYSEVEDPSWRGMWVDFASALPPDRLMRGNMTRTGEAAVVRVDPDSPAWRAGVRPGQMVLAVEDQPIDRPEDFYAAVENNSGNVTLRMSSTVGQATNVRVAPPREESDQ